MTLLKWAKEFEDITKRQVAETLLPNNTLVSTVWLGVDYSFGLGEHPPLIFETMVFSRAGKIAGCRRYSTEHEALEGHARMVRMVEKCGKPIRTAAGSADEEEGQDTPGAEDAEGR